VGDDDELADGRESPSYRRLNQLLREHDYDDFVEAQCVGFYAATMDRPGLPLDLLPTAADGYFEGSRSTDAVREIVEWSGGTSCRSSR